NEIDELSFNALTDEDIKELIPVLGPRKKFILKYNVYVKLEQGTKSISSSPEEDELTTIPQYNKPTCFLGLHDIERSLGLGNNFPDFNLRNLLETSPNGKAILNYYTEHKILDDSSRTILVDTIVRHIYLYIVQHRLKQEQYGVITNKIIQLFPEEVGATYYSPYVPKRSNGGGKCVLAKGRLVDKVRNILFRSGDTVSHRKRKINETDVEPQNTPPLDSETQSSITFLKFFDEPWDEVVSHWKNTVDYRRNSKVLGVSDFMSEWPILRNNKSTSLINLDFEYCYKNSSLLLLNNWNKFWDTIIATKGKHIPTNIVSFINIIEDTNTSTDIKILCQLKVLCHIIPPKGRMRTKKEDWKFSINECEESIVLTVPCAGDVEKEITGQREKAYLRKYHCFINSHIHYSALEMWRKK
ncbi:hypothetical protein QE152_g40770, partial [Popillia japonica]